MLKGMITVNYKNKSHIVQKLFIYPWNLWETKQKKNPESIIFIIPCGLK